MMIGGKRLGAGEKIENLALSTRITAAAAEDLAAAEPADQDQAFRLGNIEVLAVHLFVLQLKVFSNACDNGMARLYHPQALMIVALAPSQIARSAQQTPENLGEVPGMQHNQSHACQNPLLHTLHNLVGHLVMREMSPPDQHIGSLEHL